MQKLILFSVIAVSVCLVTLAQKATTTKSWPPYKKKTLIAHRGASGYAPEHTIAAYKLAIEQGADFVEPDLQITKDSVLICMHDLTLERTTNVKEVFPDRFRETKTDDAPNAPASKHWLVSDFTLAEIKQLDAGSWFDKKYQGLKVLSFQEMIDEVKGKAGLYPETKAPEVYGKLGFDMERLLLDILKKNNLDQPTSNPRTPVIIQSFSAASLKKLSLEYKTKLPLILLLEGSDKKMLTADGIASIKEFATGIGPAKQLLVAQPDMVEWAHDAGLSVTCWTFRTRGLTGYKDVREEMEHFLYDLNIDALFTDNPDQFPRK